MSRPADALVAPACAGTLRSGRLALVFGVVRGRTALVEAYAEPPFRITPLFYPAGPDLAHLILVQTTAGLFGGDRVETDIRVGRGARAIVTSQAALQVHPAADPTAVAEARLHAIVEPGAELHMHVDPLIPFAGARLCQRTRLEIASGGRLFWSDGLMAGRIRRGERWRFARLDMELALVHGGRLAYLDRFALGPGDADPAAPWAMGAHGYLGSLLACGDVERRLDALQAALFDRTDSGDGARALRGAVDAPAPGVLVGRVTAADGASFRHWQHAWRREAFRTLLGQPAPTLRP